MIWNTGRNAIRVSQPPLLLNSSIAGKLSGVVQVPHRCPGLCQTYMVQVPHRCPVLCQMYMAQVPRRCTVLCQEWCRYPAGALFSVRSVVGTPQVPCLVSGVVQIPRMYPVQCQQRCRYPAGALFSVRSGADTPQVPCSVSGAVQIPRRCPVQCQERCRNWPTESLAQHSPGYVDRRLSACTRVPYREGNSGSEPDEGDEKGTPGQKPSTLSIGLSFHPSPPLPSRQQANVITFTRKS